MTKKVMKTMDGNTAAAHVAYALSDVAELSGMFNDNDFPSAKKHARELITLPLHPFVSNSDLKFGCDYEWLYIKWILSIKSYASGL